jgi:hypothetical protein
MKDGYIMMQVDGTSNVVGTFEYEFAISLHFIALLPNHMTTNIQVISHQEGLLS